MSIGGPHEVLPPHDPRRNALDIDLTEGEQVVGLV